MCKTSDFHFSEHQSYEALYANHFLGSSLFFVLYNDTKYKIQSDTNHLNNKYMLSLAEKTKSTRNRPTQHRTTGKGFYLVVVCTHQKLIILEKPGVRK
jgi:hypothetical protein